MHVRRMTFYVTMGIFLLVDILYLTSIRSMGQAECAWTHIKHAPNYSCFALLFLPFAAGITAVTIMENLRTRDRRLLIIPIVFCLLIIPTVLVPDVTEGPPVEITQLKFKSKADWNEFCDLESRLRGEVRAEKLSPSEAEESYTKALAEYFNLPQGTVRNFQDLGDAFGRASLAAHFGFWVSTMAGFVCVFYFCFIVYLFWRKKVGLPTRQAGEGIEITGRLRSQLIGVYLLMIAWYPFRAYSLWYDSFYSFSSAAVQSVTTLMTLSVVGLLLLLWVLGLKLLAKIGSVSYLFAIVASLIATLIRPDSLFPVATIIESLDPPQFLINLAIVLIGAAAVSWRLLAGEGSKQQTPEDETPEADNDAPEETSREA